MTNEIFTRAQKWLEQDPDPKTKAELSALIEEAHNNPQALHTLNARFAKRLSFGTAGIRAPLQAGACGMNRVVVGQTAAGVGRYLLNKTSSPKVVIGYDARYYSAQFAKDSAAILQGMGVQALLLPSALPTPVLAFAVRYLDCDAGIMVTASHNPPEYNGYKVYLGKKDEGSQIIPPDDSLIAQEIDWVAKHLSFNDLAQDEHYTVLDDTVLKAYIAQTAKIRTACVQDLNFVYTAMHGVGKETFLAVLKQAGINPPHCVSEQCEPDPDFPTVNFPNPEEQGALDLAIALAKKTQAELIIAHDPDADRLAIALREDNDDYRILHGNTLGLYLGLEAAKNPKNKGKTLACSLVSSPLLEKIAQHYQLNFAQTLTGFKWISRADNLAFGFEEALGYLVDPDSVRDKDGIAAALAFINLALNLKAQGKTFADYTTDFARTFGFSASGQVSLRVTELSKLQTLMQQVRDNPPHTLAGYTVKEMTDHLNTAWQNDILVFVLDNDARVIFRPSGTEPKLKVYLDTFGKSQQEADSILQQLEIAIKNYIQ